MLALTRKPGQLVQIGNEIVVQVVRVRGNCVKLGIIAPPNLNIHRPESKTHGRIGEKRTVACGRAAR